MRTIENPIENIYLIIPVFTRKKETEDERQEIFLNWWDKKYREFEKFGSSARFTLLASKKELNIDGGKLRIRFDAPIPKGLSVRLTLLYRLYLIDKSSIGYRRKTVMICIDGSGAFEFDSIFTILEGLKKQDVVLGDRLSESVGISSVRWEIEKFEKFLLEKKYNRSLPDAQCGCWGINAVTLKRLPLTASNYEIEFDLMASVLEANLGHLFINPKMSKRDRTSDFISNGDIETSIQKLPFILHKLSLTKEDFRSLLYEYKDSLPQEYKTRAEQFIDEPPL